MNGAHSDWMEELEEILDEHISEKLGKIRKDVLKDMGPIGLLMHTRLNRISSSTFIETTSLTDEEKERKRLEIENLLISTSFDT